MAMSVRSDGSWQLLFHLLKVPSNKTYSRETTTFTAPHLHLLSFSRWREAQITWEDGKRKSSRRLNWTTTLVLIKWLNSLMDVFTSQTTTSVSSAVAVCFVLTLAWRSYQAEHDDRLILFISLKTFCIELSFLERKLQLLNVDVLQNDWDQQVFDFTCWDHCVDSSVLYYPALTLFTWPFVS